MNKETLPQQLTRITVKESNSYQYVDGYDDGRTDQWYLDNPIYTEALSQLTAITAERDAAIKEIGKWAREAGLTLAAKEAAEKERETAYSALRCEHKTLMDLYAKFDESERWCKLYESTSYLPMIPDGKSCEGAERECPFLYDHISCHHPDVEGDISYDKLDTCIKCVDCPKPAQEETE